MSDPSIPGPDDQDKPEPLHITFSSPPLSAADIRTLVGDCMRLRELDWPTPHPPAKPRRREDRKSGLYIILHTAQQHGITHPRDGFWTMLPQEFQAILALESKDVSQVVLEILMQTIGRVGAGADGRRAWVTLSYRHFARAGLMTSKAAQRGIKAALDKDYILRRQVGARRYEYAIRWKGTN
jgi:hypothetical protein